MHRENRVKHLWLVELLIVIAITVVIITGMLSFWPGGNKAGTESAPEPEYIPQLEYGIVVDSLEVIRDHVKRNEFLADILLGYDVDYIVIDKIAKNPHDIFDVRKIRVDYPYAVIRTLDSIPEVQYFVYEESPSNYVVFDIRDSLSVFRGKKEIEKRIATTSGRITSSLWNAMVENDADPNLANELSEIYAWTIDFFGIQKDDYYRVVYEEMYIDDEYVGLSRVIAANFNHMDYDLYAVYFVQDSTGDFFDSDGGSMRRTFLKAPLRYKRISSRYSHSRMHPILKYRRPHLGVDYAAAAGTPVQSVGDGVVTFAAYTKGGGYTVKVKHNGTYTTAYCHFSGFAKGIKQGVHVKQGQLIGYVGSTGLSTGPHLDFRFYRNGQAIDPLKVKSPPAKPVDSLYLQEFHIFTDSLINVLDSIPLVL
jgi:murein DD-endopeptidase MepM/ murein hydrolase activator NlpD